MEITIKDRSFFDELHDFASRTRSHCASAVERAVNGADDRVSPVSVPEVLRAAGSWIAVAMLSMIAFFAVRTLDRIEMGQQAQAVQNGEILQQLATINADIKHRDQTDERARVDVGEIRRQLRELEQRVDGIEMRRKP